MSDGDTPAADPSSLPIGGWPGLDYEVKLDGEQWADYDEVFVMWQVTGVGQQPVYWPMRLHAHGQECGRA